MTAAVARPGQWDGRDGRALAAVAAQFWVNGMVYAAVVPRLPDIRDRLAIGVGTLGLILTLAAVGGLVGSAVASRLIARFGTRRCIVLATIITLAGLPMVGLTRSVVVVTVVLAVLSMLDVLIDIGMNIQGSRLSEKRHKPVMNRLHGLWSLGTVVGGLIAVRAGGAGIPLWLHMAAVSVVLALTVAATGRHLLASDHQSPSPPSESAVTDRVLEGVPAGVPEKATAGVGLGPVLGLLGAAAVAMELTTSDWASFRLADDLGAGPGQIGLGFVAFTAGMVTGRFAGDSVQGVLGPQTLVRAAAGLAAVGLIVATVVPAEAVSSLGPTWFSPTLVVITGFYVAALGVSVVFPQLYDRAAKAPGPPGRGLAALTAGTRLAGLVAPIIVGLLADSVLSVGAAIAVVTIPSCLVTFLGPTLTDRGADRF